MPNMTPVGEGLFLVETLTAPTLSSTTHRVFEDPLYTEEDIPKANMKVINAFGSFSQQNYGNHLIGRLSDDQAWKICWNYLTALPIQRYNLLREVVGR